MLPELRPSIKKTIEASPSLSSKFYTAWQIKKIKNCFYVPWTGFFFYFSVIQIIVSASYLELLEFLTVIEIYIKISEIVIF